MKCVLVKNSCKYFTVFTKNFSNTYLKDIPAVPHLETKEHTKISQEKGTIVALAPWHELWLHVQILLMIPVRKR